MNNREPGESKYVNVWLKTGDEEVFPDACEIAIVDLEGGGGDVARWCARYDDWMSPTDGACE